MIISFIDSFSLFSFFFFNDTATTEIYTLSLHDALPISPWSSSAAGRPGGGFPRLSCPAAPHRAGSREEVLPLLRHAGDEGHLEGGAEAAAQLTRSRTRARRARTSSATGRTAGFAAAIACSGSMASTTVPPPSSSYTTTLQGNIVPTSRSVERTRWASLGLQAPRIW